MNARRFSPFWLPRLARSAWAPVALIVICVAAYLPGLRAIPPIDRDESRFAQASRQMFESVTLPEHQRTAVYHDGGLIVPYVDDRPRLNKPPLIYWLQSASAWLATGGDPTRDAIWMYRLPGVLCTVGAVLVTWRLARRLTGRLAAFLAAAALAISPVVVLDAHQARADQLLLLTVVLTQYLLWRVLSGERSTRIVVALWVMIGVGILAKGPITPLIAVLTVLGVVVSRPRAASAGLWRALRPMLGLVIVVAIVAPWVAGVAAHVGFEKYARIVFDETLGRSTEPKEGHWGPPGYHLLLVFFLLWPISLALPSAAVIAVRRWRSGAGSVLTRVRSAMTRYPADCFLLAWIVPAWVVFELVSTKLPHYVLPVYPALCILAARAAVWLQRGFAARHKRSLVHVERLWFGTGLVVLPGVILLALSIPWWTEGTGFSLGWLAGDHLPRAPGLLALGAIIVIGLASLRLLLGAGRRLEQGRPVDALVRGGLALVLTFGVLLQIVAPHALSLSTRVDRILRAADESRTRPVLLVGFQEDSLVYLTRARSERLTLEQLSTRLEKDVQPLLVLSERLLAQVQQPLIVLGSVRGFNIARGRLETVVVALPRPSEPVAPDGPSVETGNPPRSPDATEPGP